MVAEFTKDFVEDILDQGCFTEVLAFSVSLTTDLS
jgi:hypothetical protein